MKYWVVELFAAADVLDAMLDVVKVAAVPDEVVLTDGVAVVVDMAESNRLASSECLSAIMYYISALMFCQLLQIDR